MQDEGLEEARALVARHGKGALQQLIDHIVPAVRAQDEAEITRLDRQLKHVERLLQDEADIRRFGERPEA